MAPAATNTTGAEATKPDAKPPAPNPATALPILDLDDEISPENLIASFQSLAAEGDILAQRGTYTASIEAYTKALQIRPTDKHCLVCRSRCYIQIGNSSLALEDANASLEEDADFFKGLFQKAEALYAMGDFELALMFYHRGNKLRPELDEFRIGIQKAREGIENSIGDPKGHKIVVPSKLRKGLAMAVTGSASRNDAAKHNNTTHSRGGKHHGGEDDAASASLAGVLAAAVPQAALGPQMECKLLGELYDDKCYLSALKGDKDFMDNPNEDVLVLVNEGLRYLDTRVEFWRQQNPLYARPKEKRIRPRMDRGPRKDSGAATAATATATQGGNLSAGRRVRRSPAGSATTQADAGVGAAAAAEPVATDYQRLPMISNGAVKIRSSGAIKVSH